MPLRKLLVTDASGLIGSEVCSYFAPLGWQISGVDNNGRVALFGPQGDTRWNRKRNLTKSLLAIFEEIGKSWTDRSA